MARCQLVLPRLALDYEIVIVDDGSQDRTGAIAESLATADPRVRVIRNRNQLGYGGALRAGFNAATKDLVFFMDADGQFDIHDIAGLLPLSSAGCRAVLGYRRRRQDPLLRRLNGWAWNVLVSALFGIRIRDVDCAFKLYDASLVRSLGIQARGATINTEMLVKLQRLGVSFAQVPVEHFPRRHGRSTGGSVRVILRAFRELLDLWQRMRSWTVAIEPRPASLAEPNQAASRG